MARCQLDVRLRYQINKRALRGRGMRVHCLDDLLILMRPGYRQDLRMGSANCVRFFAHAAGHDHAAIL